MDGVTFALARPGPKFIKLFSCPTQLSMNFFLLMNVKMPTMAGILAFISRKIPLQAYLSLKKAEVLDILGAFQISCSADLSMEKVL